MAYTVKQIAAMAQISVRTLHYYDEIGLLIPPDVGDNRYRYYDDDTILRLQQILFYRELGISLKEIATIIDDPSFDVVDALQAHRIGIIAKVRRLNDLIGTIDKTIDHLQQGDIGMAKTDLFSGFSKEDEARYRAEAGQKYDPDEVKASYKKWGSYSKGKQKAIMAEGETIYADFAKLVGSDPASESVQSVVGRWHQHMRYFYEPSVERLRGLAQLYIDGTDFAEKFRKLHIDLPEFMQSAITVYCDNL